VTRDVGDRIPIRYEARDPDGALTAATVAVAVTEPDGTLVSPAPTVTPSSTGIYDAAFTTDSAGAWRWTWTASGAVVDVAHGYVEVVSADPLSYATLPGLKARLDLSTATDDDRLTEALSSASREIEAWCERQFNKTTTASARVYRPRNRCLAAVDDFHTTTDLVVAVDSGGDGTYEQTWSAADYQLEPLNGIVSGQSGWPYRRITAMNRWFPTCSKRPSVQVTARWGWTAVPPPVKEACLIMAAEVFKLADAPFGVAGFGEFGAVRVRMNTRAQTLLAPYRLHPMLVA